MERNSNLKGILDDVYTGRLIFAVAFGLQSLFKKREEMYQAGYKFRFHINSRFIIDPIIIYAIPEFERGIVANIIETHNNEKINVSRRFDFDLYSFFMDREEIKDGYLDRYFELKMYYMFDMLEIIYGKIDEDDCGVNDIRACSH